MGPLGFAVIDQIKHRALQLARPTAGSVLSAAIALVMRFAVDIERACP
jgi:hypothetical protein